MLSQAVEVLKGQPDRVHRVVATGALLVRSKFLVPLTHRLVVPRRLDLGVEAVRRRVDVLTQETIKHKVTALCG